MDLIIDLAVSLTSSGFIHMTEDGDPSLEVDLFTQDIPVCSIKHVLDLPTYLSEQSIIRLSNILKDKLRQVDINSDLRSFFIGVDKNNESTAAVQYTALQDAPHINAFFDRWDEIHAMLFEYSLKNKYGTLITCIQGFWAMDSWVKLSITPKPLITIVESEA